MDLNDVKIGDKIVICCCAGAGQRIVEHTEVIKVTKTQITVKHGVHNMRFLKNGTKLGESNKTRGWFTSLYTEKDFKD